MIIITIRSDKPEAEIGIFDDHTQLTYETWQAHRALAETLHPKIRDMLAARGLKFKDISAIACFKGPGSFTGLRIGLTVGNALAYGLSVPIVSEMGEDWIAKSIDRLLAGGREPIAMPEYGADVHITTPRH